MGNADTSRGGRVVGAGIAGALLLVTIALYTSCGLRALGASRADLEPELFAEPMEGPRGAGQAHIASHPNADVEVAVAPIGLFLRKPGGSWQKAPFVDSPSREAMVWAADGSLLVLGKHGLTLVRTSLDPSSGRPEIEQLYGQARATIDRLGYHNGVLIARGRPTGIPEPRWWTLEVADKDFQLGEEIDISEAAPAIEWRQASAEDQQAFRPDELTVRGHSSGTLLATARDGRVWSSADAGRTWTLLSSRALSANLLADGSIAVSRESAERADEIEVQVFDAAGGEPHSYTVPASLVAEIAGKAGKPVTVCVVGQSEGDALEIVLGAWTCVHARDASDYRSPGGMISGYGGLSIPVPGPVWILRREGADDWSREQRPDGYVHHTDPEPCGVRTDKVAGIRSIYAGDTPLVKNIGSGIAGRANRRAVYHLEELGEVDVYELDDCEVAGKRHFDIESVPDAAVSPVAVVADGGRYRVLLTSYGQGMYLATAAADPPMSLGHLVRWVADNHLIWVLWLLFGLVWWVRARRTRR